MVLNRAINLIDRIFSPLIPIVKYVGSFFIVVMMLLTVSDVIGRRLFNNPITGTYELSELMLIIVVFFSIIYCQVLKGHISINLFTTSLSARGQNILDAIMYVFFFLISCFLSWRLWVYATEISQGNLVHGVLAIPLAPFVHLESVCCALLSLFVLLHLLQFIAKAINQ